MPRWSARRSMPAILAFALLATACRGGPSGSAAASPPSATPSAEPTATAGATASAGATAGVATGAPSTAEPPAAALAVEGGDSVVGQLGSFTWNGGGSDSPWLPGTPVTVGSGERLTVTVADGVGVAEWSARRAGARTTDGAGAVGLGDGTAPVAFAAPAPGAWSVQVTVRFAGDLGSATWYWQVTVR